MQHGNIELAQICNVESRHPVKKDLPPCIHSRGTLIDLGEAMHRFSRKSSSTVPAGYTYLGQFIDHDITRSKNGEIIANASVSSQPLENETTIALDLSCLYQSGGIIEQNMLKVGSQVIENAEVVTNSGKMVLGSLANAPHNEQDVQFDLPRFHAQHNVDLNKKAKIPDLRNDVTPLIAQLHVQFLRLHNLCIDKLADKNIAPDPSFQRARNETTRIYQNIVVHDFLRTLLPNNIWQLYFSDDSTNKFADFREAPIFFKKGIPDVFKVAAFRFGHSMVRHQYRLNNRARKFNLEELFALSGSRGLGGNESLTFDHQVDWHRFFDFSGEGVHAKKIAPQIVIDIPGVPWPTNRLAIRNLFRGQSYGLPSGQTTLALVLQTLDKYPNVTALLGNQLKAVPKKKLNRKEKVNRETADFYNFRSTKKSVEFLDTCSSKNKLMADTPLWYYLQRECQSQKQEMTPIGALKYRTNKLGNLTSIIIAETFYHLLKEENLLQQKNKIFDINTMQQLIELTQSRS